MRRMRVRGGRRGGLWMLRDQERKDLVWHVDGVLGVGEKAYGV
jgi:hypothetical protein